MISSEGVGSEYDVTTGVTSVLGTSFPKASRCAKGIGCVVAVSEMSGVEVMGSEIGISELIGSEMSISDIMGYEIGMLEMIGSDKGVSENIGIRTEGRVVVGAYRRCLCLD